MVMMPFSLSLFYAQEIDRKKVSGEFSVPAFYHKESKEEEDE